MGVEGPCYRGLLGRECRAFLESFGGSGGGAMGRKCNMKIRGEEEEEEEENHGDGS